MKKTNNVAQDPIMLAILGTRPAGQPITSPSDKVATPDLVAAWSKKKDISIGEARKQFKARGYTLRARQLRHASRSYSPSHCWWRRWGCGRCRSRSGPDSSAIRNSPKSAKRVSDSPDDDPILNSIQGKSAASPEPDEEPPLKTPTPFELQPSPFGPLSTRAAKAGRATIPLTPPGMDTSQVPLNVFSGAPQAPGMPTTEEQQVTQAREGAVGAQPQTVGSRVARAVGAGAPQGSVLANLTRQTGTKGDVGPRIQDLMTESEQQQHPILTGAGEFASGMLTPEGVMMLAGTAGAGQLAGAAGQTVKQLLAAGFSAQMLSDAASKVPEISDAIRRGDTFTAKRLMAHAVLGAATAGLAAHGMFDEGAPRTVPFGTVTAPLAMDSGVAHAQDIAADLSKQSRINAPINVPPTTPAPYVLEGRAQGPEPNPLQTEASEVSEQQAERAAKNPPPFKVVDRRSVASQTVGAGESLAPESAATLRKQTDALAAGTVPAVYFPRGTENLPAPPDNATVTNVPGEKPGSGVYYHDSTIAPEQIHAAVEDGSFGKLLGYTQTKEEAARGGKPAAVIARDKSGTEIKAALVDSTNPHAIAQQAATLARQFPEAQISTEHAEDIVSERQALAKAPINPEVESPVTYKHPVTGVDTKISPDELDSIANSLYGEEFRDLTPEQKQRVIKSNIPTTKGESIAAPSRDAILDAISGRGGSEQATAPTQGPPRTPPGSSESLAAEGVPTTAPGAPARQRLEKIDATDYGRQQAQLYSNRLRDPIEREYAQSYLGARLKGNLEPRRIASLPLARAQAISSNVEKMLSAEAPTPLAQKYSPDVLDEARQELISAHRLASSFEEPGRYFSEGEPGDVHRGQEKTFGGTWYGVSSSRHIVG